MNKYTELSDFEINKSVSEKLGYIHAKSFDPCNDVSQAWEIMMKYGISVTPAVTECMSLSE